MLIVGLTVVSIAVFLAAVCFLLAAPKQFEQVRNRLRLGYNIVVLTILGGLLGCSLVSLIFGLLGWLPGIYVSVLALFLFLVASDRLTAHLGSLSNLFGANDTPKRLKGMIQETRTLWKAVRE